LSAVVCSAGQFNSAQSTRTNRSSHRTLGLMHTHEHYVRTHKGWMNAYSRHNHEPVIDCGSRQRDWQGTECVARLREEAPIVSSHPLPHPGPGAALVLDTASIFSATRGKYVCTLQRDMRSLIRARLSFTLSSDVNNLSVSCRRDDDFVSAYIH
jgi:hypothetical protein